MAFDDTLTHLHGGACAVKTKSTTVQPVAREQRLSEAAAERPDRVRATQWRYLRPG